MKILFICKSNTGRSQMAEAFFNKISNNHTSFSAGTLVGEREGTIIHEYVIESMRQLGFDLSKNVRKQLTPSMVNEADKIIIMDEEKNLPDYLKESSEKTFWDVEDAVGTSLELHCKIRDQIKMLVKQLINDIE